jgi:hypothetical protein
MKFLITENKLENLIQKMVDKSILEIKNISSNSTDYNQIPDWLSYDSVDIIERVVEIKINEIFKSDSKYKVYVDVYINSINFFDVTELLFDIKNYIEKTFGFELLLIEKNTFNTKENLEW